MLGEGEGGVGGEEVGGEAAGEADEGAVADEVAEDEVGEAALGGAEEVAGAAEEEVGFGDGEAVGGGGEGVEALEGWGIFAGGGEDAEAFVWAAADAAAELVELGEAEAFGFEDDHDGGVGDVDADFDDAGGDEGGEVVGAEALHDGFFLVWGEAAVEESDGVRGESFLPGEVFFGGGLEGEGVAFVDERVDEVGLAALVELVFEEGGDLGGVGLEADGGGDGAAAGGEFVEEGDVEVAVDGHGEGAGDGGGGHDEDVGRGALFGEAGALLDAEFVLFVDDGEAEVGEFGVAVEEGVGADEDLGERGGGGGEGVEAVFLAGGGAEADAETEGVEVAAEVEVVLFGEDLGGGHEGGLAAAFDGEEDGGEGDEGFAAADVALEEAVHGAGGGEVGADFGDGAELGGGEGEGEGVEPLVEEEAWAAEVGGGEAVPALAAAEDLDLEEEEFFEGEVAASEVFGGERGGEVDRAEGAGAGEGGEFAVGRGGGEEVGDGVVGEVFEELEGGAAEGFLGDAFAGGVDGGEALEVNEGFGGGGVVEDFEFGVVDDEAASFLGFGLAVDDEFLVGGEGFGDEGHVEPAQGEGLGEGVEALKAWGGGAVGGGEGDDGEGAAGASALELDVGDDAVEAEGGAGIGEGVGPAVEGGAVFVAGGKVGEDVAYSEETACGEGFPKAGFEEGQGIQRGGEGHAGGGEQGARGGFPQSRKGRAWGDRRGEGVSDLSEKGKKSLAGMGKAWHLNAIVFQKWLAKRIKLNPSRSPFR